SPGFLAGLPSPHSQHSFTSLQLSHLCFRGYNLDMDVLERYRGCLLGLAAGDALGTTLEFRRPGTFTPLTDMIGGGPFSLQPGQWTDDTSMALCLAASLVETGRF